MRIAYFDCFSGASGDMILGACLDAGLDLETLRADLGTLPLQGYSIDAQRVRKQGFAATQFTVTVEPAADKPHRHLKHVREIIQAAQLSSRVRDQAINVFTRLAEAEAAVHGTTTEKVHFHEVGAVDAVVDIVGACIAMERLDIQRVYSSPVPTGSGTVKCEHGIMPVPAPATAALLTGVPLAQTDEPGELTTPTGAAILTTLAESFGPLPGMSLERIGIGAGRRDGKTRANILRLLVGERSEADRDEDETDEVVVLQTNLDDTSGQIVGYVYDRLFAAGALDVFTTPIYMKKNRPGVQLTVLAPPEVAGIIESVLLSETTTFGVRSHLARRLKLARTTETVETEFGRIRIKIGRRGGQVVKAAPEFEDCRAAATSSGRSLREIMDLALRAWERSRGW